VAISELAFLLLINGNSHALDFFKRNTSQTNGMQHFHSCLVFSLREETTMEQKTRSNIRVDAGIGMFWFIGWLFTIAFAKLI
jgi:hypothetical protein